MLNLSLQHEASNLSPLQRSSSSLDEVGRGGIFLSHLHLCHSWKKKQKHTFLNNDDGGFQLLGRHGEAQPTYPGCFSPAAAARCSRLVHVSPRASRRGPGSRWSAASPWRSCCGTWTAWSETAVRRCWREFSEVANRNSCSSLLEICFSFRGRRTGASPTVC